MQNINKQPKYIDSHAHINFAEYKGEIDDIIKRTHENDTWLVNIGSNFETSVKSVEIANNYERGVYASVGCHPIHLVKDVTETAVFDKKEYSFTTKKEEVDFEKYKKLAESSGKVVAVGEVGLDYFRLNDNGIKLDEIKPIQIEVFKGFINLAAELNLPLVLHCRGTEEDNYCAYDDMLDILNNQSQIINNQTKFNNKLQITKQRENNNQLRGVIHCYGGNLEQAKKFIDLGFMVGFTGIVTFKNAKEMQEIAKAIPLEKILIETDAPFLAPDPHRGKRNEPIYVKYVAKKIAELKNMSVEEVATQTTQNAKKLFNIK